MANSFQFKLSDVHVDLIRTVAIIAVVLVHTAGRWPITSQELSQLNTVGVVSWTAVLIYQCFATLGVPLFLMLTGLLLLQPEKNEGLRVFFKKRFIRLGLPLIFWSIIYFIWDFTVLKIPFSASTILQGMLNGAYTQFWYVHVLFGLYLLTPLLRVIIAHANQTVIKYFVVLWFISVSLLPFLNTLTVFQLSKNIFTTTGYVGYFILGVYLSSVQIRRRTALTFMFLGTTLTALGTYILAVSNASGGMYFFQEYLSPTVIFASVMAFLLLLTIKPPSSCQQPNRPSIFSKLVKVISQNTLGIYFVHVIVIEIIQWGLLGFTLNSEILNPIIEVPLLMFVTLFISLGIVLLLKKIPKLKNVIT
ncbi:MAG: acyltransferase family protein [Nitrososphaerota archaeon]|jgi:surface polysaccharide O-acyltransferase-like enzyme|nr:acyltransferase family protein [Nitrososphaerota archaeon]